MDPKIAALFLVILSFLSIHGTAGNAGRVIQTCDKPGTWALTFDDGPDATSTPRILDMLKEKNVKATFFFIGANIQKPGNMAIVKRVFDEGHLIGTHTMYHKSLSNFSTEALHQDMNAMDALFTEITGQPAKFLRPPFGDYNDNVVNVTKELGKAIALWNLDSNDWRLKNQDSAVVSNFRNAISNSVSSRDKFISLDHEGNNCTAYEDMVEIIQIIQSAGYQLKRLDECLNQTDTSTVPPNSRSPYSAANAKSWNGFIPLLFIIGIIGIIGAK